MSQFPLFPVTWQEYWQGHENAEPVGAVFTRPEIVDFILDLAGYSLQAGTRLAELRVLEPSCGTGAFVQRLVDRLIASERAWRIPVNWNDPLLDTALCATDINRKSLNASQPLATAQLAAAGCPAWRAKDLADKWFLHTDFLLHDWQEQFDLVVGNPPYVRIEDLPPRVLRKYRATYVTSTDRADLYVAFIERSLQLLSDQGALAFICANRFTKNKYGTALRGLIARHYHVRYYLNLEHTQPFEQAVSAYPAIIVIDRRQGEATLASTLSDVEPRILERVRREAAGQIQRKTLARFTHWYPDGSPWLTTSRAQHTLFERLDERFPTLEESSPGTRVGIGVATGRDDVFVLPAKHPAIESERQLPLALASDVTDQGIAWSGHHLVNPFTPGSTGKLVALEDYPGLAAYLRSHEAELRERHVAQNRPASWYRTIDRVWPELQQRPKLLIPDIRGRAVVGLDRGEFYPHHNLYFVVSETWDLLALKAILRSSLVLQQVQAYSVQMRGGHVRFQAQTLRRLRVPPFGELPAELVRALASVADSPDQQAIDSVVAEAYRLD